MERHRTCRFDGNQPAGPAFGIAVSECRDYRSAWNDKRFETAKSGSIDSMVEKFARKTCLSTVNAEVARVRARSRIPRIAFDFIDGAVGRETGIELNMRAFDDIRLLPRGLVDVSARSLRKKFLGCEFDLPFGIAPMGMCGLSWPGADGMMAREAVRRNFPICMSSAASTALEAAREQAGHRAWFQIYVGSDTSQAERLIRRADAAGYETLVLTVDVPVLSRRDRDVRNGYTLPFRMGFRQFFEFALHPRWSLGMLINGVPRPKNYDGDSSGYDRYAARAGADWAFLDWLRKSWKGRLIVKGVISEEDAAKIKDSGADAICVSNHGARQLDAAEAALHALPKIRRAVGSEYPLLFDSGVRSGEDVLRALALGADFVLLGRPVLYALAAGGEDGLAFFLDGFSEGISIALAQVGLCDVERVDSRILARR